MAVYNKYGQRIDEGTGVSTESYFETEMADTISKVRALQTEPNLTFFLMTDIHAYADLREDYVEGTDELYKTSINNMRYLLQSVPCDYVVNLGDTIEGYTTSEDAQTQGNAVSNEIRKIEVPYISVIGNHDDNRYYVSSNDERLTVGERYQVFVNPTRRVVADSTGLNYYIDFDEFKIRLVCLNSVASYGYTYDSATCTWLSNVALNLPTGYKVLVFTHVAPVGAWNYNNTTPANSSTIANALSGVDTMAILCGHNHVDNVYSSPFVGATLCCTKFENENGDPSKWPTGAVKPTRTLGTATEDCWTVVVVRPNSNKINLIRFGAGSDYELTIS